MRLKNVKCQSRNYSKLTTKGELTEVFGSGTAAAVISPVGTLKYEDREIVITNNEPGEITKKIIRHIYWHPKW